MIHYVHSIKQSNYKTGFSIDKNFTSVVDSLNKEDNKMFSSDDKLIFTYGFNAQKNVYFSHKQSETIN